MSTAEAIRAEEGWNPHVYPDTLGFATIGYGFLVDSRRGEGMPREVAEYWLALNLRHLVEALTARWPPFATQPEQVQGALVEMAYQIGLDGLLKFGKMLEALKIANRVLAATEALDSLWARQTPKRAERVAARLRGI